MSIRFTNEELAGECKKGSFGGDEASIFGTGGKRLEMVGPKKLLEKQDDC